ncbi:hypothetical protein [Paraburkholderia strydomiana]|uniref:hypothetical protein n=1 Tax=Paraburkholderia strydomiana TaxID=1245417 RepID=UPI001BE86996|nr:hypothetical protein [Paraburkholderia strydomiana]MBT2791052.1 hypothetical protein [Paraburkholderia strydomiana]
MANEQLQSAVSGNRDIANSPPGPKQDCSDVVNISLFFDNTGNSKDADEPARVLAPTARLPTFRRDVDRKSSQGIRRGEMLRTLPRAISRELNGLLQKAPLTNSTLNLECRTDAL